MTKIYEALEEAGRERGEDQFASIRLPSSPPPKAILEKLLALYSRIDAALEGRRGKVVEFASVQLGDDSSRILVAFAELAVSRLGKKVLLLSPGPSRFSSGTSAPQAALGWEGVLRGEQSVDDVLAPFGGTGLMASQVASSDTALAGILDAPESRRILSALRERFDIILIDAPPVPVSPTAELLAAVADGVVLVVEAGRTRWQVVRHAMDQIQAQKGTVLGIVLNKVRHYIPDFIYRKLL